MWTKRLMIIQRACCRFKDLHGCSDCRLRFAISVPKDTIREIRYAKKAKRYGIIFQLLNYFLCRFASRFENSYYGKNTAIIRWPPLKVAAMQVMRTSFLSPRPHLFPPPPTPHRCTFSLDVVFTIKKKTLKFSSKRTFFLFLPPFYHSKRFTTIQPFGETKKRSTLTEGRPGLTHRRPNFPPTGTHPSPRSASVWRSAIRSSLLSSTSRRTPCTLW